MSDEALTGGRFASPIRDGNEVTRNQGPGGTNIHGLLKHLEARGFPLSPRVLGAADGQEVLTYLPGSAGHPPLPAAIRSEVALRSAGRAVRALHDATQGFTVPQPGGWDRQEIAVPAVIDCIGHAPRPMEPGLRRRPGHRDHRLRLRRTVQPGLGSGLSRPPTRPVPSYG